MSFNILNFYNTIKLVVYNRTFIIISKTNIFLGKKSINGFVTNLSQWR